MQKILKRNPSSPNDSQSPSPKIQRQISHISRAAIKVLGDDITFDLCVKRIIIRRPIVRSFYYRSVGHLWRVVISSLQMKRLFLARIFKKSFQRCTNFTWIDTFRDTTFRPLMHFSKIVFQTTMKSIEIMFETFDSRLGHLFQRNLNSFPKRVKQLSISVPSLRGSDEAIQLSFPLRKLRSTKNLSLLYGTVIWSYSGLSTLIKPCKRLHLRNLFIPPITIGHGHAMQMYFSRMRNCTYITSLTLILTFNNRDDLAVFKECIQKTPMLAHLYLHFNLSIHEDDFLNFLEVIPLRSLNLTFENRAPSLKRLSLVRNSLQKLQLIFGNYPKEKKWLSNTSEEISYLEKLEILRLNCTFIEESKKAFEALKVSLIRLPSLRELSLEITSYEPHGFFFDILGSEDFIMQNLESFSIHWSVYQSKYPKSKEFQGIGSLLARHPNLKSLNIEYGGGIHASYFEILINSLKQVIKLRDLRIACLKCIAFDDKELVTLFAECLAQLKELTTLQLFFLEFMHGQIWNRVYRVLPSLKNLRYLVLSGESEQMDINYLTDIITQLQAEVKSNINYAYTEDERAIRGAIASNYAKKI
jgi:hypothetical protein